MTNLTISNHALPVCLSTVSEALCGTTVWHSSCIAPVLQVLSSQRGESEDANSGTASTAKMARNTDVIMRPNAQHASNRGRFTVIKVSTKTAHHSQKMSEAEYIA